ncbi:MAG: hypothetical protein KFW09_02295 [Oscillospiraceae bacterium]|nr:hypothetical protein [Oscillospiraceae bacterium]
MKKNNIKINIKDIIIKNKNNEYLENLIIEHFDNITITKENISIAEIKKICNINSLSEKEKIIFKIENIFENYKELFKEIENNDNN